MSGRVVVIIISGLREKMFSWFKLDIFCARLLSANRGVKATSEKIEFFSGRNHNDEYRFFTRTPPSILIIVRLSMALIRARKIFFGNSQSLNHKICRTRENLRRNFAFRRKSCYFYLCLSKNILAKKEYFSSITFYLLPSISAFFVASSKVFKPTKHAKSKIELIKQQNSPRLVEATKKRTFRQRLWTDCLCWLSSMLLLLLLPAQSVQTNTINFSFRPSLCISLILKWQNDYFLYLCFGIFLRLSFDNSRTSAEVLWDMSRASESWF